MAVNELVNNNVKNLIPYVPGKPIEEVEREYGITNIIKMASNENPLGPSPKALEEMKRALNDIALYPDGSHFALIKALAKFWNVEENQIIVGNGSDELIHYIGITFLNGNDEIIQADTTFSQYEAAARLVGSKVVKVPLKNFTYDLEGIAEAVNEKTKMIFIANPNNPTGTVVTSKEVEKLMTAVPDNVIVVFDEAYYEYADKNDYPDCIQYVNNNKNVIILRTFSKIYALAGLRVGYGIANPEIIKYLNQVRAPFNVNSIGQIGAIASLADKEQITKSNKSNNEGKKYLYKELEMMGLEYTPTEANFIWININTNCRPVFVEMMKKGVIIRTGDIFNYPNYIRVTIGTEEQNKRFINTLREVL